jgi:hypothetical protein
MIAFDRSTIRALSTIVVLAAAALLSGCASEEVPQGPSDRDVAIQEATERAEALAREKVAKGGERAPEPTGGMSPAAIYIDRYGACSDVPGTNMYVCCTVFESGRTRCGYNTYSE